MKKGLVLSLAVSLVFYACNSGSNSAKKNTDSASGSNNITTDTTTPASSVTDAEPADTAVGMKVKAIRENFNRINSITKWGSVITKELSETLEGGEATAYLNNNVLEKINTKQYGETFQVITEYYLENNQLSFVYEKLLRYNRPMYYDSAAMKENNDSEAFNIDKSAITETRSYFENQKMIHQALKKPAVGSEPPGEGATESGILEAFTKLRKLFKK